MARLPDEQIERIKREVSLLRLVESQGYQITKQGKDYVVHCPFHDDKTPSCVISTKSNLFHCFGCGAGGSVIDWVMKTQGVSFRFACESLLKDLGAVDQAAKPTKRSTTRKLTSSLAADLLGAESAQALDCVVDYYHQTLQDSPEALAYLEQRGLNDPKLMKTFKLGFANRTLPYHIPENNRDAGKAIRDTLKGLGVLRKTGHEHFNGAVVVPVMDEAGHIQEMYGRRISDSNHNKGAPKHLYLPGPHQGVWNSQGLVNQQEVILCESLIDAMTFWVHGFTHVTASYGTQGFTDDHLARFKQLGIARVLIAYDRDQAGDRASAELAQGLQEEGFACFRLLFPQGMDVNQYAVEAGGKAAECLSQVLRQAQWLGQGEPPTMPAPPLAASSPMPSALPPLPEALVTDQDIQLSCESRHYRVRGLEKNKTPDTLRINLLVRHNDAVHVDTLDLYAAKQRQAFIQLAATEISVNAALIKKDLGHVLLTLEALQMEKRDQQEETLVLTDAEQEAALSLLRDPHLLDRIVADIQACGVVGEATNTLVGYIAASSRKLAKPLAVIIQSTSAAGKSRVMDAILHFMPEAERVQYSAMTGQSLFYMGETNLKHKILAIAEEEGASNASYALKLLQSEGAITIASTGKDDSTGDLVTKDYRVEGPMQLLMTTTAIDIDEELLNRCVVLTVNESQAQTQAIHQAQRHKRTLDGLQQQLAKDHLADVPPCPEPIAAPGYCQSLCGSTDLPQ